MLLATCRSFYTFLCKHQEVCRKKIEKITMEVINVCLDQFHTYAWDNKCGAFRQAFRHWGYLPEKSIFCVITRNYNLDVFHSRWHPSSLHEDSWRDPYRVLEFIRQVLGLLWGCFRRSASRTREPGIIILSRGQIT